jgi:hypothetical protein
VPLSLSYLAITSKPEQTTTNKDEASVWYQIWYNGSTFNQVEAEMKLYFRDMRSVLQAEWNEEKEKYKQTITVITAVDATNKEVTLTVPRRNYFNMEGVVEDTTLFPYHTSLYPHC